jgi:hypothetical protein
MADGKKNSRKRHRLGASVRPFLAQEEVHRAAPLHYVVSSWLPAHGACVLAVRCLASARLEASRDTAVVYIERIC